MGTPPPPQFLAHVYCGQTAGWMKLVLGMVVDLSTADFLLDGEPALSLKRDRNPLPNFRSISIVAKRLDASRCHLVWMYASVQGTLCLDGDAVPLPKFLQHGTVIIGLFKFKF